MSYSGIRWLKLYVVPTPERLRRVLELASRFERSPVPLGTPSPTVAQVVDAYERFLAGETIRFAYRISTSSVGFRRRPCTDAVQEWVEAQRPVVNIQEDHLYFHPPDQLGVAGNGERFHVALSFPDTYVQGPDWDVRSTVGSSNRELFDSLRREFAAGTRPLMVVGPTREWRLPIRYMPEMRDWIADHPILKHNGLRVK